MIQGGQWFLEQQQCTVAEEGVHPGFSGAGGLGEPWVCAGSRQEMTARLPEAASSLVHECSLQSFLLFSD